MDQVECQVENTKYLRSVILLVGIYTKLPVQEISLLQGTGIALFFNKKEKLYTEPNLFVVRIEYQMLV